MGCSGGGVGGRRGGWERGEAAVALETTGDLRRQPPPLGAVVRLLILRGVAEQQQRQSGQLPPAPNLAATKTIVKTRKAISEYVLGFFIFCNKVA